MKIRGLTTGLVALAVNTALIRAASAQEPGTPSSDLGLDEVVVTAQRRSEELQRVPISMQALVPEVLEQHQVATFDDYQKLLPSVSFESLGPGNSQLFFRASPPAQKEMR